MKQRHKHADVIIAWAEGKDVQVWDENSERWRDVIKNPTWCDDLYRIKPPTNKYRVALCNDGCIYTITADTPEDADFYEEGRDFIRWLTDWIEYEE